ncbi:MAG: ABC transporter permease [Proteobacteria bacterium]|nr:ABC transporter permease [Pseudomonadota bacterium]
MTANAHMELSRDGQTLHCRGEWTLSGIKKLSRQVPHISQNQITLETSGIIYLDTAGAYKLLQIRNSLQKQKKGVNVAGFSAQHQMIYSLVETKLQQLPANSQLKPQACSWLTLLGHWSVQKIKNTYFFLAFLGEVVIEFGRLNYHTLKNVWRGGLKIIQTAGCQALPIVAMMSFLIGIVLAYQVGLLLKDYGANVYVVEATGIAILREFSPLMTAIIIAGRTSTAFAALIGSMKVNSELDALATMGIAAVERIVLPRVCALVVTLPLLVVWSIFFSLAGSMIMAKSQLNIGYTAFLERFTNEVHLTHYVFGLIKTPVFAFIIATVGCFQGFQTDVNSDSVGLRTTAAAVQAIFLIIVADAFFSILFSWRGL